MLGRMTLDDALRDLAATGNKLPRTAMQWALDNWDEAGPRFGGRAQRPLPVRQRQEIQEMLLGLQIPPGMSAEPAGTA